MYTSEQKYKRLQKELTAGAMALALIFVAGTLWYKIAEGWMWSESAYMTMITLTTVGFAEVHPLDQKGQLFTMCLILMGVGTFGYIINRFTEAVIQGYFQDGIRWRQQRRMFDKLKEHYIVCGFSRTGRQIALEFEAEGIPFVIIDSQDDQVAEAQKLGHMVIEGDATLDASLQKARIEKAACIVAALRSDAENLYTVLSAKALNPEIRAIARASTEEAVTKLQRAGADAVVSPYITGGKRLAAAALRPQVMDFVDGILTGAGRSYYMEEFKLDASTCPCVGQTLSQSRLRVESGSLVLAIRRADGNLIPGPTGDTRLYSGDVLICMGTAEQLRELNRMLGPISARLPRIPRHQE